MRKQQLLILLCVVSQADGFQASRPSPLSIVSSRASIRLHSDVIREGGVDTTTVYVPDLRRTTTTDQSQQQQQQQQQEQQIVKVGASNLYISLVKSLLGAGVLAMPASVATLGNCSEQIMPIALGMIAAIGTMNAFYFSMIGRICDITGAKTYIEAWEKTIGQESSSLVGIFTTLKTALACLAYSMILADSFQGLAITAGFIDCTRTEALLSVTLGALLPLCLVKDLSVLAPFSLAGVGGFLFTAGAMVQRYQDGSYIEGGHFYDTLEQLPSFGETGPELHGIVMACMLATAFVAQYNAPRFHNQLQDNTPQSFDAVTYTSFATAVIVMGIVAIAGFGTFGAASQPLIFNSYSTFDPLITVCRLVIASSLVVTYPLPFVGLRDNVMDMLPKEFKNTVGSDEAATSTLVSIGLLSAITVIASNVHDLAMVLSIGGGTVSTAVASVFPTLMIRKASKTNTDLKIPANIATILMGISVAIGATGVTMALQNGMMMH